MPQTFSISTGLVVRRGARLLEFDRRLQDNTIVFIDQIDKSPHQIKLAKLFKDVQAGSLAIVTGGNEQSSSGSDKLPLVLDIESLPEKHRSDVHLKYDCVRALKRQGLTRGMRRAVTLALPQICKQAGYEKVPSVSTILSAWRKLDMHENSLHCLVSGHVGKQVGKRKGWAAPIVREFLRAHYCVRSRPTLVSVHLRLNRHLALRAEQERQDLNESQISFTTLRRHLSEIDPYAVCVSRYGKTYADNKWRYSLGGAGCTRALQRYEIDHTILDIVVVCDVTGLPLGRPTITVVIDAYSSYVTGFFVSFWGAGLATTLSALKVAFAPKDEYTANSSLVNPWLGMGICELLVMDNGLEFHSPQLRSIARHLHMDMLYCPVRTPWLKPVVERAMGTIGMYLPGAGKVEKRLDNYLPLKAENTAAVTFSSLCSGLLMAFVDVHGCEINHQKLARPIDLMRQSLEELPPPFLPGPMHDLDVIVGESMQRCVGKDGVLMDYLRYSSPELREVRRGAGLNFRTEIRCNPGNLDHIFVRVPNTAQWLPVPSCMPAYTDGLSIVQHAAVRKFAGDQLKAINAEEVLTKAKLRLQDHWMASIRVGKRLSSQHLKAMSGLTSAHALTSLSAPEGKLPASLSLPSKQQPLCGDDLKAPASEIPVFGVDLFA